MSSALDKLAKRSSAGPVAVGREIDVPMEKIRFDPTQPRKAFHNLDGRVSEKDDAYIAELAESISGTGLIHPITVQEMGDGSYLVVVGECRTRAHLFLKRKSIRAVVRNDLVNPTNRLLYQLAENITRQDLTNDELALSISQLMKGDENTPPMSQVAIAKTLGKSESWVSRFVRFGDDELQRLWVKPGIVVTPENLYRMSLLPKPMQVDILRRVNLDEDHPEFLEKPVSWAVVNEMSRLAKAVKNEASKVVSPAANLGAIGTVGGDEGDSKEDTDASLSQTETGSATVAQLADPPSAVTVAPALLAQRAEDDDAASRAHSSVAVPVTPSADVGEVVSAKAEPFAPESLGNGVFAGDEIGQAFAAAAAAADGQVAHSNRADTDTDAVAGVDNSKNNMSGKYQLPDEDRAAILEVGNLSTRPPVSCRVTVANVLGLMEKLKENDALSNQIDSVQCSLVFPGELAQLLANELVGVIVDYREIPAVVQSEVGRLF